MVASSVVYLLSRARVRLVLRIRAALTMLVAFAAALLVDAYSTYTVCAYVFHNDLWRVQVRWPQGEWTRGPKKGERGEGGGGGLESAPPSASSSHPQSCEHRGASADAVWACAGG